MRAAMKALLPVVLLALGACLAPPPSSGDDRPIARVAAGQQTESQQASNLRNRGVNDGNVEQTPGSSTPEIDSTRRFEYADVTVSLDDPQGMKTLVPYLLKPEVWTLIKCEMLSSTKKQYRFQKVSSTDGRALPDVDVFRTRR